MAGRKALVRRLKAVETLGSIDIICTDKTGTLTKNEMTVKRIYSDFSSLEVEGSGYSAEGRILRDGEDIGEGLETLFEVAVLCNDANLREEKVLGDPTEGALLVVSLKYGMDFENIRRENPREHEISFDPIRKRMSTVHRDMVCVKGAPEILLDICDRVLDGGKIRKLRKEDREKILQVNEEFANSALRVLAFAYKPREELGGLDEKEIEKDLVFLGLMGMIDPPREGVKEAVARCRNAGIRPVMVTGDHILTASAIAREVGIMGENDFAVEGFGADVDVNRTSVYARVKPEHKVSIVEALRGKGHIVAMTGDASTMRQH